MTTVSLPAGRESAAADRIAAADRARIRPAAVGVAIVLAILAFLPIANWIPAGHDAPWYAASLSEWLNGGMIAIGVGVVLAILSRRSTALWRDDALRAPIAAYERAPGRATVLVALLALVVYAGIAQLAFAGRPLLIDELVQTIQAQLYAHGHLSLPAAPYTGFFSSLHIVDTNGRWFSQFPAGGPAMLVPGVILGAPWLTGPVAGAVTVLAWGSWLRHAEPRAGVRLGALVLLAFAPFTMFMSASYMNHVTALMWVMVAMACLARVVTSSAPRPWIALAMGLAYGIAGTIRPVDALAFALPAGLWILVRALRDRRRWSDALPAAAGVALPLLALLWINARTTGHPLLFGYEMLWGKSHALGFHRAPWGVAHTPGRGLELINLYFLRLQSYLFETPVPSLVPCIAAIALAPRLRRFDRYLAACSALIVALYFAYWHDGNYLGPRFMYLLLPALALWTARFLPELRARCGRSTLAYRTAAYAIVVSVVIGSLIGVPLRGEQYRHGMLTMKWDAEAAARQAGVHDALVLVRESWGAQLLARMWALGVPRTESQLLYDKVDACTLDGAITTLEQGTTRDTAALEALEPLLADSARVVASPASPDTSERYLPGTPYSARCRRRVIEDRQGFTLLTPLLLEHASGNVYARDLQARDSVLLREYPDRPVYLLRPASPETAAQPRFERLSRDSLMAAWRAPADGGRVGRGVGGRVSARGAPTGG